MSLGEIIRIGAIDTALGMGAVFGILIFISICIWILGLLCKPRKAEETTAPAVTAEPQAADSGDSSEIEPEIIAAITAAIHQYLKDEYGDSDEYIVRKVRRATWKHIS